MSASAFVKRLIIAGAMLGSVACANETALPGAADLAIVEPEVAENGDFRVAIESDMAAVVEVQSHEFASMDELYRFAIDEMGGEPVLDESGAIVGVHGTSVLSGDVQFRDAETGELFRADDLAQAFLGGADGSIRVADEVLPIGARLADVGDELGLASAALSDSSRGCVGDDCISGHSWKNNYVLYRSVGSETTQSSGGYSSYSYACCRGGGSIVYQSGRAQCRVVTEWEPADPENGIYRPTPVAYDYRPADSCTGTATRNRLTLGVTAIGESGWATAYSERSEENTRELSFSNWGVGLGVSFLGIDDVHGVCGFHSGTRGSTTRTRAGSATDAQCDPTIPVFLTR
jgi:hypothetical protein